MIVKTIVNNRFPHLVVITRLKVGSNPFESTDRRIILYKGEGRSYTDTTTTGDKLMDRNRRKASIPVRFDEWKIPLLDGDIIAVKMGNIIERGVIKDFEPDNDRTVIYWEYGRV